MECFEISCGKAIYDKKNNTMEIFRVLRLDSGGEEITCIRFTTKDLLNILDRVDMGKLEDEIAKQEDEELPF